MCGTKRLYVGADVFVISAKIERGPLLLKVQTFELYYFPRENISKHTEQRGDVNVRMSVSPADSGLTHSDRLSIGVSLCLAIYDNMTDLHTSKTSHFQVQVMILQVQ